MQMVNFTIRPFYENMQKFNYFPKTQMTLYFCNMLYERLFVLCFSYENVQAVC